MLLLIRKAYPAPAESVVYIRQIEYFSSSSHSISLHQLCWYPFPAFRYSISCVYNTLSQSLGSFTLLHRPVLLQLADSFTQP